MGKIVSLVGTLPSRFNVALTLPNFTLMSRVYSRDELQLKTTLLKSYEIFWPDREVWPTSRFLLVWDAEDTSNHEAADRMPSFVQNVFEEAPPDGTMCSAMRRNGYSRQQWSNFVADQLLVGWRDNEYVGFVDADSFFISAVLPDDLFDWDPV